VKVDKTLVASVALHVLVLGWGLISFSSKAFESVPEESLPVEMISADQLAKVTAGMKTGKKENPKPLVEKVAEAKPPVEDAVGKISDKPPVVTDTAPPPPPPTPVEKPVEKKPDPPKPVAEAKPKEEPKPIEKKPDPPKIDPIAEALKKEEKKPPPKPVAQAAPPPPPQPPKPKAERTFDQSKIAALLDKRDPTRQAVTGDALNSNAALGLAHGKAADNSATWGSMFKEQVLRCWKKPYGGIEAQTTQTEFSIRLKRDGSLEVMPSANNAPTSAYQRVFQESGARAIIDCQPYKLPAAFFDEWKFFYPIFDSKDL
jgi:outer membrane biosynthesis protein TonB